MEDLNITQINVHQTTGTGVNKVLRTEESTQPQRPQQVERTGEIIQEQNGPIPQNHTDQSTRDSTEDNIGNPSNTNSNNNQHNTVNNNVNVSQVPEDRSQNLQNYFQVNTQPNVGTPPVGCSITELKRIKRDFAKLFLSKHAIQCKHPSTGCSIAKSTQIQQELAWLTYSTSFNGTKNPKATEKRWSEKKYYEK